MLFVVLHDRSLSSVARDESRMAGGEPRMVGGEPRMTGECCRPEKSIHRCVRTHSHLYSYIYGLVALLDNIQSSFSKYHYLNTWGTRRIPLIYAFFFTKISAADAYPRSPYLFEFSVAVVTYCSSLEAHGGLY